MRIACSEAYKLWAPCYDTGPNPLLALEARLISNLLSGVKSATLIDVACGTGRSMTLFSHGFQRAIGADSCPEMLAEAQRKKHGGSLVLATASRLPFASAVADVTLCSFAISYFSKITDALREMARVTKADGRVIISDLHPLAIQKGWTRSFRAGGVAYEIDCAYHDREELRTAITTAGMRCTVEIEAPFSEYERPLFRAAGKEHLFEEASSIPAVRIGICHKL